MLLFPACTRATGTWEEWANVTFTQLSCVHPSTSICVPEGIKNCPKNKAGLQKTHLKNLLNNLTMRYTTLTYNFVHTEYLDVKCSNTQTKRYLNIQGFFSLPDYM